MPKFLYFIIALILLSACNPKLYLVKSEADKTQISNVIAENEKLNLLIKPFKDSINKDLSDTIGYTKTILTKEQPEGSLNNFLADALLEIYGKDSNSICVLNYGGIRVPSLPIGAISKKNIFELLPFDNEVALIDIKGADFIKLCNTIAIKGGWPIAGFTMQIENKKANQIFINGHNIYPNTIYHLITNDYMANGGDDCNMLPQYTTSATNAIMRDVIIKYIQNSNKKNEKIAASKDGRIIEIK